jgi:hypothetical protein
MRISNGSGVAMSFKYIFYLDVEEGKEYLDKKIYASFLLIRGVIFRLAIFGLTPIFAWEIYTQNPG